jgi:hypothetical protein
LLWRVCICLLYLRFSTIHCLSLPLFSVSQRRGGEIDSDNSTFVILYIKCTRVARLMYACFSRVFDVQDYECSIVCLSACVSASCGRDVCVRAWHEKLDPKYQHHGCQTPPFQPFRSKTCCTSYSSFPRILPSAICLSGTCGVSFIQAV